MVSASRERVTVAFGAEKRNFLPPFVGKAGVL
jgi:hypothetical protein